MEKTISNTTKTEQNLHNYLLVSKCIHSGCHNNDDDDDDDCDGGVGDGNNDNDANSNFYLYRRGSKDHRDRVAIQALEELRYKCYCYVLIIRGNFRVSKPLTFKMRPSAQPFWLKWALFA